MPVKIYRRNIFIGVLSVLYFAVIFVGTFYLSSQPKFVWDNSTVALTIVLNSIALGFAYFIGVPALRRDPVLIIDVEKIQNVPSDIIIYWSQVYEISLTNGKYPYLIFTMTNGPDVRVGIAHTFENNTSIYKTVLKYFENSLKADGQLAYKTDED